MPDEEQKLGSVDWRRVLPFTHLFRAFRVAIHPSKLFLGLLLLLMIYAGGKCLDHAWPAKYRAVDDEIQLYADANTLDEFHWHHDLASGSNGLFHSLFYYEVNQFNGVANSVVQNEWFETPGNLTPSVVGCLYNMAVVGPAWMAREHPVFGVLLSVLFLIAWSLFGGAIARLAAVNVARDEKVSIRQALNFSLGKFFSFASAPIIPMLIVAIVGVLLAVGALVANVPFLGPVALGAFFFLALLGGFIQTLVILGTVGGFNLMYPTVAVEGSDSFDAISRSFSYVYARPWRMLFYTAVSIAYGAVTYLFVRLFIIMMLALAHFFVARGVFVKATDGGALFPTMWISPVSTGRLTYSPNYSALNWGGRIGAGLVSCWIYLMIGLLGSYAISFYFSANTLIYLLIRRELDATEMDEVYLEQTEEEYVGGPGLAADVVTAETTVVIASGSAAEDRPSAQPDVSPESQPQG